MSDGHDKLKSIGTQKIHEVTHISRFHIQAVIHESYDNMTKIQFLGFISILEREYGIDLEELRQKGIEYFDENKKEAEDSNKLFVANKKKKNLTLLYTFLAIIIFVGVSYISINLSSSTPENVDNTTIENARENIEINITNELNTTEEINSTKLDIKPELQENKSLVKKTFKIIPSVDVWVGYIDMDTHKKFQKIVKEDLELDANKTWLLTFGHGHFSVDINGEKTKYNDKKTMRFIYKDSNMTKISYTKFKELNEGSQW